MSFNGKWGLGLFPTRYINKWHSAHGDKWARSSRESINFWEKWPLNIRISDHLFLRFISDIY